MADPDPGQSASESGRVRIGDCDVVVTREPLERALGRHTFDAVVSSDDTELSMGGGVSASIRELAGPEFEREARARAPVEIGTVVVTGPGNLPVRYVMHAITVDWTVKLLPTPRLIAQLGRELFVRCEALGIETLLLPAIGA